MNGQATPLVPATCGAVSLLAPTPETVLTLGEFGHLWQWTGTDDVLVTLTVTVRRNSQLTSAMNIRDRLTWQLDQIVAQMDAAADRQEPDAIEAPTGQDGQPVAVGQISGVRRGMAVHERVLVTTNGSDLYTVQVIVGESTAGHATASQVIESVRVHD